MHYTEDTLVQQTTAEYLEQQLGWKSVYAYNNEDFRPDSLLGRASDSEVVLTRYLRAKLVELNPGLPDEAYDDAVRQIVTTAATQSLLATNREKYNHIRDGVQVTFRNDKGERVRQRLRVFDFSEPTNNDFLCVRMHRLIKFYWDKHIRELEAALPSAIDEQDEQYRRRQIEWMRQTRKDKVEWGGRIGAVQPRIRLMRSFDERHHSYQGYVLRIEGMCGGQTSEFLIAVGEGAHQRHRFEAGMEIKGQSAPVDDPRKETAAFYKTSGLKVVMTAEGETPVGPPFLGVPPDLETYRGRGHRRLDTRTYDAKCSTCMWGCRMPVEMIIDQWNPSRKQYRYETFCYGPKSCSFYRAGPTRKVPGRKGMSYTEEDWVDEDATVHRGPDD